MDEVSSDRYEELAGVSPAEYEQRLLVAVRHALIEEEWIAFEHGSAGRRIRGALPDGSVDSIELVGEGEATTLVIVFRTGERPGRVFGWRVPVWPAPDPYSPVTGTPEWFGTLFGVYLNEWINTIPFEEQQRDGDGVEWIADEL